jgi:hypothetical protein
MREVRMGAGRQQRMDGGWRCDALMQHGCFVRLTLPVLFISCCAAVLAMVCVLVGLRACVVRWCDPC